MNELIVEVNHKHKNREYVLESIAKIWGKLIVL